MNFGLLLDSRHDESPPREKCQNTMLTRHVPAISLKLAKACCLRCIFDARYENDVEESSAPCLHATHMRRMPRSRPDDASIWAPRPLSPMLSLPPHALFPSLWPIVEALFFLLFHIMSPTVTIITPACPLMPPHEETRCNSPPPLAMAPLMISARR